MALGKLTVGCYLKKVLLPISVDISVSVSECIYERERRERRRQRLTTYTLFWMGESTYTRCLVH